MASRSGGDVPAGASGLPFDLLPGSRSVADDVGNRSGAVVDRASIAITLRRL